MAKVTITIEDDAVRGINVDSEFDPVIDGDNISSAQQLALDIFEMLMASGHAEEVVGEYEDGEVVNL